MAREFRIIVPDRVARRINEICRELKITPQDLILRAIVKVLEEFEDVGKGERR